MYSPRKVALLCYFTPTFCKPFFSLQMTAMAGGVGRKRFVVELEMKELLAKKNKDLEKLDAELTQLRRGAYHS